jgi:hypothetical protein
MGTQGTWLSINFRLFVIMLRYQVEVEATRLKLASEGLLHSQHKQDTEGAHYYFKENERRISKKEYKLQECRRERDGWRERSADEHLASSSFYVCVWCVNCRCEDISCDGGQIKEETEQLQHVLMLCRIDRQNASAGKF